MINQKILLGFISKLLIWNIDTYLSTDGIE